MESLTKLTTLYPKIAALSTEMGITLKTAVDVASLKTLPERLQLGAKVNTRLSTIDFTNEELRIGIILHLDDPAAAPEIKLLTPALHADFITAVEKYLSSDHEKRPDAVSTALLALKSIVMRLSPNNFDATILAAAGPHLAPYNGVDHTGSSARRYIPRPAELRQSEVAAAEAAAAAAAAVRAAAPAAAAIRDLLPANLHPLLDLCVAYDGSFSVLAAQPLTLSFTLESDAAQDELEVNVVFRKVNGMLQPETTITGGDYCEFTVKELLAVSSQLDIDATCPPAPAPAPAPAAGATLQLSQVRSAGVRAVAALVGSLDLPAASVVAQILPSALESRLLAAAQLFDAAAAEDDEDDVAGSIIVRTHALLGRPVPRSPAFMVYDGVDIERLPRMFPVSSLEHHALDTVNNVTMFQLRSASLLVETNCCHAEADVDVDACDTASRLQGTVLCPTCAKTYPLSLIPVIATVDTVAPGATAAIARVDAAPSLLLLTLRPNYVTVACGECGAVTERQRSALARPCPCPECGALCTLGDVLPPSLTFTTSKGTCTRALTQSVLASKARAAARSAQQLTPGTPLPNNGTCSHASGSNRWFKFSCCNLAFPCDDCHFIFARENPEIHGDREPVRLGHAQICGFCSRTFAIGKELQSVCPFCHEVIAAGGRKTRFWEGGKGCRDKSIMSANDRAKYRGSNKVKSKKAMKRLAAAE